MAAHKGSKTPSLRHHKPTDQAVVTIDGRDFYLGKHGTLASRCEYDRLVAEWLSNGRRLPTSVDGCRTVNELILTYWRFASRHYRKPDGSPTSETTCIKGALKPLRRLYGPSDANNFSPLALKAVRQAMINSDLYRNTINSNIGRIRRMFKWAVENELAPSSVYQALATVGGLRRGRSEARETEPVRPVPDKFVDAVCPFVAPPVWALIELQGITGMRGGEGQVMRGCDLEMAGKLWLYRPESHKTEHHGHQCMIELGPKAQAVIRPFLKADLNAYLFSPRDAAEARNAKRRDARKSPMTPSQSKRRRKRKPKRQPKDHYTKDSYCRAIKRACIRAGVPHWHPHQLRHTFATRVRKEHGLEVARILLGHRSAAITETYAELDRSKAAEVVARIG